MADPLLGGTEHLPSLPYPDQHFDYQLCCASCYYLDGESTWQEVRAELARVMKPGGLQITSDPYGLRNGSRFVAANNAAEIVQLLLPEFRMLAIGHHDDFYSIRVSSHFVVAQRL